MRGKCNIYSKTISGLVTKLPNSDSEFWHRRCLTSTATNLPIRDPTT